MIKQHIKLNRNHRKHLESLLSKGKLPVKVFKRATGLLELDRGKRLSEVAQTLGVDRTTVGRWRDNYKQEGLKCLKDAVRPGRPIRIDGVQRAKITALACSKPPKGYARWSLRLLADKVVESGYCKEISYHQVGNILKKTI